MKTARIFVFVVFSLLLANTAFADDAWTSVSSKNFSLVGNASEKDIRGVATKLEQFREVFRQLFPRANFNSTIPTTVVVFKSDAAYKPFKPVKADGKINEDIAGYFQPGEDVNYITLAADGEENLGTIYHEYVHFIVNNNFGRASVPPWFNEGLAEYYQTFRMQDDKTAVLGEVQLNHLRFLQQQKLIPFEQFFSINYFSLHNQGNHGTDMFYAQSWALMHYLQQGNKGARREQLTKFLNLLLNNKPPREAFQEAFQTDYAQMEKELKSYVEQRLFTATAVIFKDKIAFDAEIKSAALTDSEANAYLGDLLLHTNRLDEAVVRLQQAIAGDEKNAMAYRSLGMTKARQNKFGEAQAALEKAIALDSKSYLSHYYHAFALSREDMDQSGFVVSYDEEKVEKMRASLAKAMELNAAFPESYRLLAFVNLVNNQNLDEAAQAIKKALSISPGNQWYSLTLAQIYMRQENFEQARAIAKKIIATGDENLRANAQILLSSINSFEAQLKRIKEAKPNAEAAVPIEMSAEEAMNLAINRSLRRPQGGEQRIVGFLTGVECDAKGQIFNVRAEDKSLKYRLPAGQNLMMIAFSNEADGVQIGCEKLKHELFVVATYRPTADAKSKTDGEIVALEFAPRTLKLLP